MKQLFTNKIFIGALCALVIGGGALAVYSTQGNNTSTPASSTQATVSTPADIESAQDNSVASSDTNTQTTSSNTEQITQNNSTSTAVNENNFITEEEAIAIALAHAEINASDANYIHTKFGYDDGIAEYDVEFWANNTEYDYEIAAENGTILGYDRDAEYNYQPQATQNTTANQENYIGEEQAKTIALAHAQISASDATNIRSEFDFDDGFAEYEVEWRVGNTEYEYTINAITGDILEFDVDYDG